MLAVGVRCTATIALAAGAGAGRGAGGSLEGGSWRLRGLLVVRSLEDVRLGWWRSLEVLRYGRSGSARGGL